MAAAGLSRDEYRWRWNFRVRQLFNLVRPADAAGNRGDLTDVHITAYAAQNTLIEDDLRPADNGGRTQNNLSGRLNALRTGLAVAQTIRNLPRVDPMPVAADRDAALNAIFPDNKMPTRAQLNAARPRAPGAAAAQRVPAGPPPRPIGIRAIAPLAGAAEPTDNIILAENPPTLYEAIDGEDIRILARELSDPNYNPEQTFKVTINEPTAGAQGFPIIANLTPLQYAALKSVKGIVRFLLLKTAPDFSKRINSLNTKDAVLQYRKADTDKDDIRYIFDIVDTAIRDATDDFTSGSQLDSNYGKAFPEKFNQDLSKKIYTQEYNDLQSPKPLPATAPKSTSTLLTDAKQKGKEDGSRGAPRNPEYATKRPQEQEAYGKEYDKELAKYHGEKDGKLNDSEDVTKYATEFSSYYSVEPAHKDEVDKLYKDAYNANRNKSTDLAKEAGYVGTYPITEAGLSGNYFGFGPELSKIIGFETTGKSSQSNNDASYKEGLAEFIRQFNTLVGQAKYAGYTDGIKKNAKYTTPGNVAVQGKQYVVDFGKLNTRLTELPSVTGNKLVENPDFTDAQAVLDFLRIMRDDKNRTLEGMLSYLRDQSDQNDNSKVKQTLKPILVSQKGGVINPIQKNKLRTKISQIGDQDKKSDFLSRLDQPISDAMFDSLKSEVDTEIQTEEATAVLTLKKSIKLKIGRLYPKERLFLTRLNDPDTYLQTLEAEVNAEITAQKDKILPSLNMLSDGERKTRLQERLDSDSGYLYLVDNDLKNALSVDSEIRKIQDLAKKSELLVRFNNLNENLYKLKTDVQKEVFSQTKTILDKKKLIENDIPLIKNNIVKTDIIGRLNEPNITKGQLETLYYDVTKELTKQKLLTQTEELPDGAAKTDFIIQINALNPNLELIQEDIKNVIELRKKLKDKISYIPDTVPEKADFTRTVNSGDTTYIQLQTLERDIEPFVPSWAKIIGEKTGAISLGTSMASIPGKITSSIASIPGKIVTGLGSVSTKTQLYDLVQQAFSSIPKYATTKLKDVPVGVSPDDPSLKNDVNPIKRLQTIYDKEFERGTKEAMRARGGTRRKSKKSNRLTKKQGSKK